MKVLHVGCGRQPINEVFDGWDEVRMDIDASCQPDIVASLTDMGDIGEFDAVFGSHVLEHFAPHDVTRVLSECRRVLKDGGYCMMVVPNLAHVRPTREPVYDSAAGPITGLDMFYGKESMVADNPYMAHKTGFIAETLQDVFAGFRVAKTYELTDYNLMGIGVK
jgi:SAM-dependent methyltransferase